MVLRARARSIAVVGNNSADLEFGQQAKMGLWLCLALCLTLRYKFYGPVGEIIMSSASKGVWVNHFPNVILGVEGGEHGLGLGEGGTGLQGLHMWMDRSVKLRIVPFLRDCGILGRGNMDH